MSYLIGLAGGTGTGKSTVAQVLGSRYPEKITVIHLDNYYREWSRVPRSGAVYNVDHPDAVDFDAALRDISSLLRGEIIQAPVQLSFPDPSAAIPEPVRKGSQTVNPKPCIIVEGHFALHDSRLRDLMSWKIYLDLPIRQSLARRTKHANPDYVETVLIPMHEAYVAPTKAFADRVINLADKDAIEVAKEVEVDILSFLA